MRPVFIIGIFILAIIIQNSPSTAKPLPDSDFSNLFDQAKENGERFLDKTADVIQGRRKLNVNFSSEGVSVSVGPSPEEIAAYVACGIVVLAICLCCCCCIKLCCCSGRTQPTTIVYQQMVPPSRGRAMDTRQPQSNGYGGPVESVNFDPLPTVKEISNPNQPPPYKYPAGSNVPV